MTQYNQSSYSGDSKERLATWPISETVRSPAAQAEGDCHPGPQS